MKKKIINIILTIVLFLGIKVNVYADATASATIKVSTSSTIVGNSGTATLTISSNEAIGQIYGTFTCGDLGKQDLSYVANSSPSTSKSYTINWKASKAGTYTCAVEGLEIGTLETVTFLNPSVSSKTITVVKATSGSTSSSNSSSSSSSSSSGGTTTNKKEYSSDNNLSSLSIEGYDITPEFNKDTTEYKLTVDQAVEKIKVVAKKSDDKASISGDGEINLSLGENTISVKVTAENGNEKVYKIIVTVEDLNPIKVNIGEAEFTVVKKNNDLIKPLEYYEESSLKISDQDVVAYVNEKTNVTLVILKDSENQLGYYIYNEQNNTYQEYNTITVGNITLQLLDSDEELKNYKKYSLELQEQELSIYKIKKSHKVGLIYGTNIQTGNTSYYVYDQNEETLSKYYDEEVKIYQEEIQKLKSYLMIFMGIASFIAILSIIISIHHSKKKKHLKKYK